MEKKIKNGKEIINEFFNDIKEMSEIEEKVVNIVIELYDKGKFTANNLSNALSELREDELNDKN